jgi:hypothetical protein
MKISGTEPIVRSSSDLYSRVVVKEKYYVHIFKVGLFGKKNTAQEAEQEKSNRAFRKG